MCRRSADELVKLPDDMCENGDAHYYVGVEHGVMLCRKCKMPKWFPLTVEDALRHMVLERKHGKEGAYRKELAEHKEAQRLVWKLLLRRNGPLGVMTAQESQQSDIATNEVVVGNEGEGEQLQ